MGTFVTILFPNDSGWVASMLQEQSDFLTGKSMLNVQSNTFVKSSCQFPIANIEKPHDLKCFQLQAIIL